MTFISSKLTSVKFLLGIPNCSFPNIISENCFKAISAVLVALPFCFCPFMNLSINKSQWSWFDKLLFISPKSLFKAGLFSKKAIKSEEALTTLFLFNKLS